MFYADNSESDNDEDLTGETSLDEPPHRRYYSGSFHDYDTPALCHGGESYDQCEGPNDDNQIRLKTELFEAMTLVNPSLRERRLSPAQLRRFYSQRRSNRGKFVYRVRHYNLCNTQGYIHITGLLCWYSCVNCIGDATKYRL